MECRINTKKTTEGTGKKKKQCLAREGKDMEVTKKGVREHKKQKQGGNCGK